MSSASFHSARINAETLPATFAAASAEIEQVRLDLRKRALESAAGVVRVREEIVGRMRDAGGFISSGTEAALNRIDDWMTSVSVTVIAALPGGRSEPLPAAPDVVQHRVPQTTEAAPERVASLPAAAPALSPAAARGIEIGKGLTEMPPAEPAAAVAAPSAPLPAQIEPAPEASDNTPAPAAEKTVLASLGIIETAKATLAPPPAAEARILPEAKPAPTADLKAVPDAKPAPLPEVKIFPEAKPVAAAETKSREEKAEEKQVFASLGRQATAVDTPPVASAAPTIDAKAIAQATPAPAAEAKPREEKAEEKQVFASLGRQPTAVDTPPLASAAPTIDAKAIAQATPAPAAEAKARDEKPEEKQIVASLGRQATAVDAPPLAGAAPAIDTIPSAAGPDNSAYHADPLDPIRMAKVPMSSPLKIRALTRADIPAADKFASLAPATTSDARKLPPEQQRVAYDAPVVIDEPTAIGRRRWTEEAAKYRGLGSPEALLEALKHMGAGAKSLGLPASLWCADFMNLVLRKSGLNATGSRAALSYLKYGTKIDEPRVGAIAIFTRGRNGGHIGIVRGTDGNGNPIIVSGNHNHKVAESVYPKSRVLAYVVPK